MLVAPTMYGLCYPFPQTYPLGKPCRCGDNPAQQPKNVHFPLQKNPPHQIAIFMELPNTGFIYSCTPCYCIISLTRFMYRYIMLILISRWLLKFICSTKKVLNGQNSSKQNSEHPSPPFNAIWKTLLLLLLVFLFNPSFFHFKLYKFFWPHFSCDCMAYELIKYSQFQISGNRPD